MTTNQIPMTPRKRIALVAHDHKKADLEAWVACNRTSAEFIISSPLMDRAYDRMVPDYEAHNNRLEKRAVARGQGHDLSSSRPLNFGTPLAKPSPVNPAKGGQHHES